LTEKLDLTSYQKEFPQLPEKYLWELGAGWIHGTINNPLVSIFEELWAKYEPNTCFKDQLSAMFPGML
jgi:hypothetical protein